MMLRLPVSLALFLGFGALGAQAASSTGPSVAAIDVTMDHAKIQKLPEGTTTLVIGNPIVADVTMLKGSGVMVVTGKGFGETNLLALDSKGNVLADQMVRVNPTRSVLVVQRGATRESFSCNPLCMPSVQIGDDPKTFDASSGQITAHNGLAQSGPGAPTPH